MHRLLLPQSRATTGLDGMPWMAWTCEEGMTCSAVCENWNSPFHMKALKDLSLAWSPCPVPSPLHRHLDAGKPTNCCLQRGTFASTHIDVRPSNWSDTFAPICVEQSTCSTINSTVICDSFFWPPPPPPPQQLVDPPLYLLVHRL